MNRKNLILGLLWLGFSSVAFGAERTNEPCDGDFVSIIEHVDKALDNAPNARAKYEALLPYWLKYASDWGLRLYSDSRGLLYGCMDESMSQLGVEILPFIVDDLKGKPGDDKLRNLWQRQSGRGLGDPVDPWKEDSPETLLAGGADMARDRARFLLAKWRDCRKAGKEKESWRLKSALESQGFAFLIETLVEELKEDRNDVLPILASYRNEFIHLAETDDSDSAEAYLRWGSQNKNVYILPRASGPYDAKLDPARLTFEYLYDYDSWKGTSRETYAHCATNLAEIMTGELSVYRKVRAQPDPRRLQTEWSTLDKGQRVFVKAEIVVCDSPLAAHAYMLERFRASSTRQPLPRGSIRNVFVGDHCFIFDANLPETPRLIWFVRNNIFVRLYSSDAPEIAKKIDAQILAQSGVVEKADAQDADKIK